MSEYQVIYRNILNDMREGVMVIDLEGKVRMFNGAAERITDLSADTVVGQPFGQVFLQLEGSDDLVQAVLEAVYDSTIKHELVVEFGAESHRRTLAMTTAFLFGEEGSTQRDRRVGVIAVFSDVTQALQDHVRRAKMEHDLDLARTIQMELLPASVERCAGYDLAAFTEPADETGGDIWDMISMDGAEGEPPPLMILLADSTGHGISAALSVTQVRAMLRIATRLNTDLDSLCRHLNEQLLEDLPDWLFVTTFLGILDPAKHSIEYRSLGQAPLLHFQCGSSTCRWLNASSPPAGLVSLPTLPEPTPIEMAPGDLFVLLSDGFYEYENPVSEEMGKERIGVIIEEHHARTAEEIVAALQDGLEVFAKGTPQGDDLTAIVVKRVAEED